MRGSLSAAIVALALLISPLSALGASHGPVQFASDTATTSHHSSTFHSYAPAPDSGVPDIFQKLGDGSDARTPELVIGSDERTQVTNTGEFPYSAIALLEAGNDDEDTVSHCTATFVGPTVLLTAAHCLYIPEMGGWTDYLLVLPGLNGEDLPYGYEYAINAWIPQGWIDAGGDINEGYEYDYGLVTLESDALSGSTGELSIGVLSTGSLEDANFNPTTSGYPGDKPLGTQWKGSQSSFTSVDDIMLLHEIDSFRGQSGSAVWRGSDMAIVGIESFETDTINGARRISQPLMDEFLNACQQLDCSLNYFIEGETGPEPPPPPPPPPAEPGDRPTEPAAPIEGCMYFDATQHNLCEPFLSYWQGNGGLPVFGYPTTEAFNEMNQDLGQVFQTQYFERERMEYHPDNAGTPYEILLGRLGHEVLLLQGRDWATFPKADPSADHYYAETGHAIAPQFWEYWSNHGLEFGDPGVTDRESLALFGLPLSEPQEETNSSGDTVLTQWFERARFEFHPDSDPGLQVKLGLLGNEFLAADSAPPAPEPPEPDPPAPDPPDPDPPGDEIPAEGQIIAGSDLTDWTPFESPLGDYGEPTENGYAITNAPDSWLQTLADADFSDGSFSVRTRVLETAPLGLSCLIVRATPNAEVPILNDGAYHLCTAFGPLEEGGAPYIVGVLAIYESEVNLVDLGAWDLAEPVAAAEWHELKIIAQGSSLWFLFDGSLVGSVQHSGPTSGAIGISAWNITTFEETSSAQAQITDLFLAAPFADRVQLGVPEGGSQVEFTDLTVRELQ